MESEIKAGASVGDIITFEGMCSDQAEFEAPGDVIISLTKADEDLDLLRDGSFLRHDCVIGLGDSLLGCSRSVKSHPAHPKGLTVDIPAGTQSGEIVVIKGLGMPLATGFSDLLVKVTVRASAEEKKALETHKVILQSIFIKTDLD